MVRDSGNTISTATAIGDLSNLTKVVRNQIGGRDRFDFYKFTLSGSASYNFSTLLNKLKANANIALLNSQGAVLGQSNNGGAASDSIGQSLSSGVYYLRVKGTKRATGYKLALSALASTSVPPTSTNTAPSVGGTRSLTAQRGGLTSSSAVISSSILSTTDAQQGASALTYQLTTLPQNGSLFRNGVQLAAGSTFTQADINSGGIVYQQHAIKTLPNSTGANQAAMSGVNAAWISGSGSDENVYFYNGTTGQTTKLSPYAGTYGGLRISGSTVVWSQYFSSGDESDIWYSTEGAAAARIDTSTVSDYSPVISGSNIAFIRNDKSGTNVSRDGVYLFNTSTGSLTQLEFSTDNAEQLRISGSNVAWARYFPTNDEYDIRYSVGGGAATSINTSSSLSDSDVAISGSTIAFVRNDKSGTNVSADGLYTYNVSTGTLNQVESFTDEIYSPRLSGTTLVWERYFSANSEYDIRYSINGAAGVAVNNSTAFSDFAPIVSGNNIAFYRNDAGTENDGTYLFNTTTNTTVRITSGIFADGLNGRDVLFRNGSGATAQVALYNGNATSDVFGFTVTDGSLFSSGTVSITIA